MIDYSKRKTNERKFPDWEELPNGGRRYYFEVEGRFGWKACYLKEVDKNETTQKFHQEIYDNQNNLIEIHIKFPIDQGHIKVG